MHNYEGTFYGRMKPYEGKTIRLFGSISTATSGTAPAFLPYTSAVGQWRPQPMKDCCDCGAWMLQTSVIEILRSSAEASISPIGSVNAFGPGNALPAGATRSRGRSQVKLRINAEASTINRQWDQDVGQSLEINADCVCVEYLAPSNFVEITSANENNTQILRSGLVLDVWLSVSLNRIEAPIGLDTVTLTDNLFVAANSMATIPIPPFATQVTIYQTVAGAASGFFTQWYGDPALTAGSLQVGQLAFIPGERRTEQESVLPNATHLQSDQDSNDRAYVLRWTIRP